MPELPVIAKYSLEDTHEQHAVEQAIWGLHDWHRAMLAHPEHSRELPKVRQALTTLLNDYCTIYNGVNARWGAMTLVENGYLDSLSQAKRLLAGDFSQETPDTEVCFKDSMYVIGIVGRIQAGKGICGKILEEDFQSTHYPFIKALYAFAYAMGFRPDKSDRAKLVEINNLIKPRYGNDRFARSTLLRADRQIRNNSIRLWDIISCDGFRSEDEARLVLAQPHGYLFSIWASQDHRYERACLKPEVAQRPKSRRSFILQDRFEMQNMMAPAIALAESPPFNNNLQDGGKHLREQVRTRLSQIMPPGYTPFYLLREA